MEKTFLNSNAEHSISCYKDGILIMTKRNADNLIFLNPEEAINLLAWLQEHQPLLLSLHQDQLPED